MTEKVYNVGVEAAMELLNGKWKSVILCRIAASNGINTGVLRRSIHGISQKV
ncbi:hypothetical protein NIE88_17710 [Sporolactobacillus shoreicorticis]|uniref:Winged helix-turn-helix transcriptional regulator n=1 Tax=Sporolactobacillus shoreicorticis TaxID=1923877 RepID=A0ABW5RZV1_9BACL|nr:hypothetical protein [Sporolactobacillus shoreicorticis]MCO7127584.1 hypothetical protein [Sporolactobacillus shoreicorticis]